MEIHYRGGCPRHFLYIYYFLRIVKFGIGNLKMQKKGNNFKNNMTLRGSR